MDSMNSVKKLVEPFAQLQGDHEVILGEFQLIEETLKALERKPMNSGILARKTIDNLRRLEVLLTEHSANEEKLLLPWIRENLDLSVSEWIIREHQQISRSLQDILGIVAKLETKLDEASVVGALSFLIDFDSFTRAHFSREENVLFWFASHLLSKSNSI